MPGFRPPVSRATGWADFFLPPTIQGVADEYLSAESAVRHQALCSPVGFSHSPSLVLFIIGCPNCTTALQAS